MLKTINISKLCLILAVFLGLAGMAVLHPAPAHAMTYNQVAGKWLASQNGVELYVELYPNGYLYFRLRAQGQMEEVRGSYRLYGNQIQILPNGDQPYVMNIGMTPQGNLVVSDTENYYEMVRIGQLVNQPNAYQARQPQNNYQGQQQQIPYQTAPQQVPQQAPQQTAPQPEADQPPGQVQPFEQQDAVIEPGPGQEQAPPGYLNQPGQNPGGQPGQAPDPQPAPQQGEARPAETPAAGAPGAFMVYSPFSCYDVNGLKDKVGQPLKVFDILIPQGWKADAKVIWKIQHKDPTQINRTDLMQPVDVQFKVLSPDQHSGLAFMPEIWFADVTQAPAAGFFPPGSNYGGFVSMPMLDPINYIKQVVIPQQAKLENYQIVQALELPALAQSKQRELNIMTSAMQMASLNVQHRAAMVRVKFVRNGVASEGVVVSVLRYLIMPGISLWMSTGSFSYWAPQESFEAWQQPLITCVQSLKVNPSWAMQCIVLANRNHKGIANVDAIAQRIDSEIWANRANTNAEIHRQMYPLLAPFAEMEGPDGVHRFLPTGQDHQIDPNGNVRSGNNLPDEPGWTKMKLLQK